MKALTAKQRQFLRGLAHPLAPVVRVGKGRLTPNLVAEHLEVPAGLLPDLARMRP